MILGGDKKDALTFYIFSNHRVMVGTASFNGAAPRGNGRPASLLCVLNNPRLMKHCNSILVMLRYHFFNFDTILIRYLQNTATSISILSM